MVVPLPFGGLGGKLGLDRLPNCPIDDRRMLSLMDLGLVQDATGVERVRQDVMDAAPVEHPPTGGLSPGPNPLPRAQAERLGPVRDCPDGARRLIEIVEGPEAARCPFARFRSGNADFPSRTACVQVSRRRSDAVMLSLTVAVCPPRPVAPHPGAAAARRPTSSAICARKP